MAYYQSGAPPQYGDYGAGGFQAPRAPAGPPPGADPQLWQWFTTVDTDRSGHIAAHELQQALVNGDWSPFDLDTVKLLMSIFDVDRSGTIGFNEFQGLWNYIKDWQGVFRHFDTDRSGAIDNAELNNALRQFGYNLSPALLGLVQRKYVRVLAHESEMKPAQASARAGAAGGITFDRFVRCCVVLKQVTEAFQKLDPDHNGSVTLNYDTFVKIILQAP